MQEGDQGLTVQCAIEGSCVLLRRNTLLSEALLLLDETEQSVALVVRPMPGQLSSAVPKWVRLASLCCVFSTSGGRNYCSSQYWRVCSRRVAETRHGQISCWQSIAAPSVVDCNEFSTVVLLQVDDENAVLGLLTRESIAEAMSEAVNGRVSLGR